MKKYLYISFIAFAALAGCQEIVDVELKNAGPRLVVTANITDAPGPYFVDLGLMTNFYSTEGPAFVNDATVTISDDAGHSEVLSLVAGTPGRYQTNTLQGTVGRTYQLQVLYQGQTYQASSQMLPVASIDSLTVKFIAESDSTFFKEEGYYVYLYSPEPHDQKNYYRFKVYKNDSLFNGRGDFLFTDDVGLKDYIPGWELPYRFDLGDTVKVEMQSLTRENFKFLQGLTETLFNDGGLFSPPPTNPPGNMSNGALGYFSVTAMSAYEVIVKEE